MKTFPILLAVASASALACCEATAQWAQQTLNLKPGWNAVFLEVQPEPADCDSLFANLPIESVWAWNRRPASAEFIQDPSELLVGAPDWLTYLPATHSGSGQSTLFALQGGRPYLIRVADGATAFPWTVTGRASLARPDWVPNSLNFAGFHLREPVSTTFQQFFAGAASHQGQPVIRLNAAGRWESVNPAITVMNPGEACWVRSSDASDFSGPLEVVTPERRGIVFGPDLVTEDLRIINRGNVARRVTIAPVGSAASPSLAYAPVSGPVPLSYRLINLAQRQNSWVPLSSSIERQLAPGEEWHLQLEVRRRDMAGAGHYQSHLEVRDDWGVGVLVPVSAEAGAGSNGTSLVRQHNQHNPGSGINRSGLWVGTATLRAVSQPAHVSSPNTPSPTPAEFQFRLIIHVDDQGHARLLQSVLQLRKEATYKPDPANPGKQIVDVPAHSVLITDPALAAQYSGGTVRDGRVVGRRLSSAVFGFTTPIQMEGTGGFGEGTYSVLVTLAHDDPLNPFRHRYHPDHDGLDERFEQALPEGHESFTVNREITLKFTTNPPSTGAGQPGWGDVLLGGEYNERITGVHRHAIHLAGEFQLQRASRVAVLNETP